LCVPHTGEKLQISPFCDGKPAVQKRGGELGIEVDCRPRAVETAAGSTAALQPTARREVRVETPSSSGQL